MTTPEKVEAKLNGTLKKFTITVILTSGMKVEVHSDQEAKVAFETDIREAVLRTGYGDENCFRMQFVQGWTTTVNTNT